MKMKDPFNKAFIFVKETFLPSTTIVEIVDSRDTTIRHGVCRRKLCAKTVDRDRHVHNVFCVTSD